MKGKLIDILEAIEIEESPIEQPIEVTKTENKKKSKRAKKLEFSHEEHGFIFMPRKNVTRSIQWAEKMLGVPLEKIGPSKKKKGKEVVQEKSEIEVLQEQLIEVRK